MISFLIGIGILIFGYMFYSKYVEKQFEPTNNTTPAYKINDGVDFVPMKKRTNMLIHLLNIAGLGPILGAIQGILFGPIAFILIPLGCIFMGGVHDYFSGMISLKNNGAQITELIKKYLGKYWFYLFIIIVSIMLILLTSVFVYTAGDIIAERFFNVKDFSLNNPIVLMIYLAIALYFIVATMFPIDKIIGKCYPLFCMMLLIGTILVLVGFFTTHIQLQNINIHNLNLHPKHIPIIPMFFITVSCGLLSGFHSTQSTIISRTLKSEYDGKIIFYGMMCVESIIAMVWAAATMQIYALNIVPKGIIGTANVINFITDYFVPHYLAFIVIFAVIILPITSGDTALRGLRMIIAEATGINQVKIKNRFLIITPIALILSMIIYLAKTNSDSFTLIWRYFNFVNQLIAIPTFIYASIYLKQHNKNYLITLIPGLFFIFITMSFIFNAKIGFNLNYHLSLIIGFLLAVIVLFWVLRKFNENKN